MRTETSMVRLDRTTVTALKKMAYPDTMAGYLRKFTESADSLPTLADLVIEIRSMGQALKLSETRMKILDIHLAKASPAVLEDIRGEYEARLEGKPAQSWEDFQREFISGLAATVVNMTDEQRNELVKLDGMTDEQRNEIIELNNMTDEQRESLVAYLRKQRDQDDNEC